MHCSELRDYTETNLKAANSLPGDPKFLEQNASTVLRHKFILNKSVNFATLIFEEDFCRDEMASFRVTKMKHHRLWNSLRRSITSSSVSLLTFSFVVYFSKRNQFWLKVPINAIIFLVKVASRGFETWLWTYFTLFDTFKDINIVRHNYFGPSP